MDESVIALQVQNESNSRNFRRSKCRLSSGFDLIVAEKSEFPAFHSRFHIQQLAITALERLNWESSYSGSNGLCLSQFGTVLGQTKSDVVYSQVHCTLLHWCFIVMRGQCCYFYVFLSILLIEDKTNFASCLFWFSVLFVTVRRFSDVLKWSKDEWRDNYI